MADFASRLRELRKQEGLRQQDLAETLGLTQATIANYEQKRRFPDEEILGKVADFFAVSLDFLLGRVDGPEKAEGAPRGRDAPVPLAGLAREYFEVLMRGERDAAFRLVDDARRNGAGIPQLYLEVLSPSLHEIGRLWETGEMSVGEEHYFTESTQLVISQLHQGIQSAAGLKRGFRAVVFAVYGETHVIGARMVSDCLELDGWDVYYLGGNLSVRHAMRALLDRPAQLLVLSVAVSENLGAAEDLVIAVRGERSLRSMKIMIGGQALQSTPALWRKLGADGTAHDAVSTVAAADRLFNPAAT